MGLDEDQCQTNRDEMKMRYLEFLQLRCRQPKKRSISSFSRRVGRLPLRIAGV